ncbi:MAG TPA: hypothetical protein PKA88_11275 [Polyangiaceae bacterium]|nr:hypothetical protein [Polyangiaceae bacterium]
MDYFAELGGHDAVMSAAAFVDLDGARRIAFTTQAAEAMAPAILGRVAAGSDALEICGRYAVHGAMVELSTLTGAFLLRMQTRRALSLPGEKWVVEGASSHPSRQLLDVLPHGTGALLNRLLDSAGDGVASFTLAANEIVLVLEDPTLILLSARATQRLTSVAHLSAYIAVEAEARWPLDENAPLTMPCVDPRYEQRLDLGSGSDCDAPPIPGYGIPPDEPA